ncbi:mechanosensitive ion channel family protein [Swingsia samuiensis]|uniref:Mechanosensitive ion channel family protein n=1 Tax=Swingsia samuiensis TaxID=1293412 RepID=A0A4Y6UJ51_9PROT|nr:mechanosensitive ion channel family protein [Swingsia samuiensis]QDH17094.1 mechanosensitive ion channel family protein [Swingsia samuiensis]
MPDKYYVRKTVSGMSNYFSWLPAPLGSIIIILIAALIAQLFSRVITASLLRLPWMRKIQWIHGIVERLEWNIRYFLMLLAAMIVLPATNGFEHSTEQFLEHLLACFFILNVGFSIIRIFHFMTDKYLTKLTFQDNIDNITVRSHQTQIRVLRRLAEISFGVFTVAAGLMTFNAVQQFGISLFASAGAASLVVGLSAKPAISNLIAGIQIAITQPIRMEDMLILNGDWVYVEEINATYVVLRTWDRRRYIVPITYFLENPFQNWTHSSPALTGSVFLWLDYRTPVAKVREMYFEELAKCSQWDGDKKATGFQVVDSDMNVIKLRMIAGAINADEMWDLCCNVRERMLQRIQAELPECLPRGRTAIVPDAPQEPAWPEALMSPPINRPAPGVSYNGPDIPSKPTETQS